MKEDVILSRIEAFNRDRTYAGRFLLRFDALESTNLFCLENSYILKQAGLVVMAGKQTRGRGSRGRLWESGTGDHLFCSFVVHPHLDVVLVPSMTIFAGLAVFNTLKAIGAKDLSIKWPNDILLGNKKVSGILCESRLNLDMKAVVIGIGVNISGDSSQFSAPLKNKATTLSEHGIKASSLGLLDRLSQELDAILLTAREGPRLMGIFHQWERASNSIGKEVIFNNGQDKGVIRGLDGAGHLVVETQDGKVIQVNSARLDYA